MGAVAAGAHLPHIGCGRDGTGSRRDEGRAGRRSTNHNVTGDTNLHDIGVNVISYIVAFPDLGYLIVLLRRVHEIPVL